MSEIKHKTTYCFRHITQVPKNINESPKPFFTSFLATQICVFVVTHVCQISWSQIHPIFTPITKFVTPVYQSLLKK